MASLMEVRDMLALQGRMEAKQLSARLQTPQPLIDAMLERMEAMGKVVRISETSEGCLSGSCKSCPEGKAACRQEWCASKGAARRKAHAFHALEPSGTKT